MSVKSRWVAATALAAVVLAAFFTGRTVEERALAEKIHSKSLGSGPTVATIEPPRLSHQQLAVAEVFALPFADFYEALRAAPGDAREKWANELAAMPEGPQRRAAISGFYKLLVQFDPAAAVKAIGAIEDVRLQRLALDAAVNAAPGFALPLMAELCLNLQDRIKVKRDHLSDVVLEWSLIDAPAVMRFIDQHTEAFEDLSRGGRFYTADQVLSAWAAVDPIAAKEWIDRKEEGDAGANKAEALVEGWYENDHAAAVAFTLAHAEEPRMSAAIGAIVRWLYLDSKDEATKFIASLPENRRPDAFKEAFRHLILMQEEDSGDATMTPRAIASWMIEFPPAYWQGAVGRLFGNDERASADLLSWIQQSAPGVREAAAGEYFAAFDKSPSEKIAPVLQVADPVLRDRLFSAMMENRSLEFDEARTAATEAPLSLEQKRHFLEIVAAAKARRDQEEAAQAERVRAETDQGSEK
jgi:hypothetical protein